MYLKTAKTKFADVLIFENKIFSDKRGFFFESYNHREFNKLTGLKVSFVQDNYSKTVKNTIRGLHYQINKSQGKLIRVIKGKIFDVIVDLKKTSPTFGKWICLEISDKNGRQVWIPPGYAHGFCSMTDDAHVFYKTTEYWYPNYERCINWNDKDLKIKWPTNKPNLSDKDKQGVNFKDAEVFL